MKENTCRSVKKCKHGGKFIACSISDGSRCIEFEPIDNIKQFKFGQKITVSGHLYRTGGSEPNNDPKKRPKTILESRYINRRFFKYWKIHDLENNRKGIFLGYRTLSNGISIYSYDEGVSFEPREYFKAALVCLSERENPIYVALEQIVK